MQNIRLKQLVISPSFGFLALTALRIVTGVLFAFHGLQKLTGFPGDKSPVELASQMGFVGILELLGGLFIILGLFTRATAFLLSGLMAVAYFKAHAPGSIWPIINRGELAILYCFVFFFFFASGPGPYSLDSLLQRHRSHKGDQPKIQV